MEPVRYYSRRIFCRRLLTGLGALLCSRHWPAKAASPYGRSAQHYTAANLPTVLQAKSNPHLIRPHRQLRKFGLTAEGRAVPGAVFTTGGYPVRAVAAGIVHFVGQRPQQGRQPEGFYIRIAHDFYDRLQEPFYPRVTLYRHQAYRSTTYALESVSVEHWQSVRRGQLIGYGMPTAASDEPAVKLVLEENGNPVNPDDYGPGHRFMRYVTEGKAPETDLEQMHRRLVRQKKIIRRLHAFYSDRQKDDIQKKAHGTIDTEKFTDYPVIWSTVERFRYLTHRYRERPQRFPGLSSEDLDSMIRSFIENQPIVLSLPLTHPS